MQIQQLDLDRPGPLLDGLYAAFRDAYSDLPGPTMSALNYAWMITKGWSGELLEAWVATSEGEVVGGFGLALPRRENTHIGAVNDLVVRRDAQRRGVGTALLEHAAQRVRAHGRTLLTTEAPADSAFARARGFTGGISLARRVLDLRKADWDKLRAMTPEANGYRLERWLGPTPPELLPDLSTMMAGMNDAPSAEGIDDVDWSVERVKISEDTLEPTAQLTYSTLARRVSDGAPAGYTRIYLDKDDHQGWSRQADTTVLGGHRGHRLGLLLKLSNLFWLRDQQPDIDRIVTWNATSNTHMLAINEAMGFELLDEWNEWQLPLKES